MQRKKRQQRNNKGSVIAEAALAIPIFFMVIFTMIELGRAMYVLNTMDVAAQRVASSIGTNARRGSSYDTSSFYQYIPQNLYFPGSVVSRNQFSFDVQNSQSQTTVMGGMANANTSTKVVVTVSFPPPGRPGYRIPLFDPGRLIGQPIFGPNGLPLMSTASCLLERSRRPIINP